MTDSYKRAALCQECGLDLLDVKPEDPCPDCGAHRRDAWAYPGTAKATVTVPEPTVVTEDAK